MASREPERASDSGLRASAAIRRKRSLSPPSTIGVSAAITSCGCSRSVVGEFGVDGVVGDRPAAVVADHVDLEWLATGVPAGEGWGVHRPFVAPAGEGEGDR